MTEINRMNPLCDVKQLYRSVPRSDINIPNTAICTENFVYSRCLEKKKQRVNLSFQQMLFSTLFLKKNKKEVNFCTLNQNYLALF